MKHKHQIRVRYGECDQMGFVHHSRYALYLEEARTEILRSNGLAYKDMEDEGIIMPSPLYSCMRHVFDLG